MEGKTRYVSQNTHYIFLHKMALTQLGMYLLQLCIKSPHGACTVSIKFVNLTFQQTLKQGYKFSTDLM